MPGPMMPPGGGSGNPIPPQGMMPPGAAPTGAPPQGASPAGMQDPEMMKMLTAYGQLYGFNPQNMKEFAGVLQKLQMQVSQTKPGTAAYNIANNNLQTLQGMFQQLQAQSQAQQTQTTGAAPGGLPPNAAPPGLQQG